jgi:hypothetical protein
MKLKNKNYYMAWATTCPLIALLLMILGFVRSEPVYFIGALIVGAVAFYWIFKAYRIYSVCK